MVVKKKSSDHARMCQVKGNRCTCGYRDRLSAWKVLWEWAVVIVDNNEMKRLFLSWNKAILPVYFASGLLSVSPNRHIMNEHLAWQTAEIIINTLPIYRPQSYTLEHLVSLCAYMLECRCVFYFYGKMKHIKHPYVWKNVAFWIKLDLTWPLLLFSGWLQWLTLLNSVNCDFYDARNCNASETSEWSASKRWS